MTNIIAKQPKSFFIADTHCNHNAFFSERIPVNERIRPFTSSEVWDEYILDAINNKVDRRDTLYILGDFSFYATEEKFRKKIKCKNIWFIFGNHDHRNRCKRAFGENRCFDIREIKICGVPTTLCHYQMFVWPKSHHLSYSLHGHTHDQRSRFLLEHFPEMRSLDV